MGVSLPAPDEGSAEALRLLGEDLGSVVAAIDEASCARLVTQIKTARVRQNQLIDEAVQTAIKGVPLPVRGLVKRALVG